MQYPATTAALAGVHADSSAGTTAAQAHGTIAVRDALVEEVLLLLLLAGERTAEARSARAERVVVASRSGSMHTGAAAAATTSVGRGEVILVQIESLELREGRRKTEMETSRLSPTQPHMSA